MKLEDILSSWFPQLHTAAVVEDRETLGRTHMIQRANTGFPALCKHTHTLITHRQGDAQTHCAAGSHTSLKKNHPSGFRGLVCITPGTPGAEQWDCFSRAELHSWPSGVAGAVAAALHHPGNSSFWYIPGTTHSPVFLSPELGVSRSVERWNLQYDPSSRICQEKEKLARDTVRAPREAERYRSPAQAAQLRQQASSSPKRRVPAVGRSPRAPRAVR